MKNDLGKKLKHEVQLNKSFLTNETTLAPKEEELMKKDKYEKDLVFWRNVPDSVIERLYQAWKIDFQMFGYDPNQYFVEIGLEKGYIFTDDFY